MRIAFLCIILITSSCDYFQYSPHAIDFDDSQRDLNIKNIKKMKPKAMDDTIRFVVTGDSQEALDELEELVENVNTIQNLDFLILAGDITQKGIAKEYKWAQRELEKLTMPYITVIGNHDLQRNGENIFKAMFGDLDYSFTYGNTKFICFNNNSYLYDFDGSVPNLEWLKNETESSSESENLLFISHIPPFWNNEFDPALVEGYANLLASNEKSLISLHAHANQFIFREHFNDGIDYLVVPSIDKASQKDEFDGKYILITIISNSFAYEILEY